MATTKEKEQIIDEYKAEQRNRIRDRVDAARARRDELDEKAKTDPEAKAALVKTLERQRDYHRRQIGVIEQRLARLAK